MTQQFDHKLSYDAIVTCYNAESTIKKALKSILSQTWSPKNIYIIDDFSTDSTLKVLEEFGDEVTLIRNKRNMGQSYSRNLGAALSKSDFLIFFDDDDESLPDRSLHHLRMFKKDAHISFVSSIKIYENGYETLAVNSNIVNILFDPSKLIFMLLKGDLEPNVEKFFVPASTCAVKRTNFLSINGYDESFRRLEDVDFAIRFAIAGYRFSFSDSCQVLRFSSVGADKGSNIDSRFEFLLINKFRSYFELETVYEMMFYAQIREYYFERAFLKLFGIVIRSPRESWKLRRKILPGWTRLIHDIRKGNF